MGIVTFIGAIIGALCLFGTLLVQGAPQQAALAGMACALAIIPYVIFRVFQLGEADRRQKKFFADVSQRLDAIDTKRKEQ